jgi:NADPH-dependent glutamate synthase beta subunit-like oxidoreductase
VSTKPFAITLGVGTSLANKTGSWRVERPVYVDRLPPCNNACAAREDIQGWLYEAEEGNYEAAWRLLMRANPLPAIMGRACFHPCETSCNRVQIDEAVGINAVERFLGDKAIEEGWRVQVTAPPSGRRVLVVGSGPAGLAAAYHLRLLGHDVEVHEAAPLPGGMLRYGIPAYRLPRDVVDAEIDRIVQMGVKLVLGARVAHVSAAMAEGGFDAAFVGIGAQRGKHPDIPSGDAAKILDAVSMLHGFEEGESPVLGRRVVVYGGGDTAMDAARTARRLGATETIVVYRRTRDRMPAHDEEVLDAQAEGVQMRWLSTVARADGGRLRIERMVLNDKGVAEPTGEFEDLEADSLVLALGQDTDLSLVDDWGDVDTTGAVLNVDANQMTGRAGVFAGGDASSSATAERTATAAVGHGARAAEAIHAWLAGGVLEPTPERPLATVERLNSWYYADAPRTMRPHLEAIRRRSNFDEVVGGLTAEDALFEARRCMSCGNCFECDNCFGVCPDNAVIKLGPGLRYEFNLDYCKGCGICAKECPCGAIDMVPEHR